MSKPLFKALQETENYNHGWESWYSSGVWKCGMARSNFEPSCYELLNHIPPKRTHVLVGSSGQAWYGSFHCGCWTWTKVYLHVLPDQMELGQSLFIVGTQGWFSSDTSDFCTEQPSHMLRAADIVSEWLIYFSSGGWLLWLLRTY